MLRNYKQLLHPVKIGSSKKAYRGHIEVYVRYARGICGVAGR